MRTVKTKKFQHPVDISIQETGTVENLMLIALAMNVSPTEAVAADTEILIPDTVENNIETRNYYRNRRLYPASDAGVETEETGIFDETFDDTFE